LASVDDFSSMLTEAVTECLEEEKSQEKIAASKAPRKALLVRLRAESVRFITVAGVSKEMRGDPSKAEIRNNITKGVFRCISSPAPEVHNAAKAGLAKIIEAEKLPKELLQGCLRPVLLSLAENKRLNVPTLEGLARLLELLSSHFNITLVCLVC